METTAQIFHTHKGGHRQSLGPQYCLELVKKILRNDLDQGLILAEEDRPLNFCRLFLSQGNFQIDSVACLKGGLYHWVKSQHTIIGDMDRPKKIGGLFTVDLPEQRPFRAGFATLGAEGYISRTARYRQPQGQEEKETEADAGHVSLPMPLIIIGNARG